MRPIHFAAALLALCFASGATQAQDRDPCPAGTICASAPQTVTAAMAKAGLKPVLSADDSGDPLISSAETAYPFDVTFYGCEANKACDSLRFEVQFQKEDNGTIELANKWNADHRFLQASVKKDGRFVLAWDVGTIGGMNARNFQDALDWWTSMLGEAAKFFAAEAGSAPAR